MILKNMGILKFRGYLRSDRFDRKIAEAAS
jgi:hypothetical protein